MGHSYSILRRKIVEKTALVECVDLPQGVFEGVTVDNVLIFLRRSQDANQRKAARFLVHKLFPKSDKSRVSTRDWDDRFIARQSELNPSDDFKINLYTNPQQKDLFKRLEAQSIALGEITESSQGIILYKTEEDAKASLHTDAKRKPGWKKLLRGTNIARYETKWEGEYVHYGSWLWCARDEKFFSEPKILLQAMRNKSLSRRLIGTYDSEKFYNAHNLANIISKPNVQYDLKYVLAIFNSRLINYWYKAHFPNVNINPGDFRQIPIRRIDFNNAELRSIHDGIVRIVDLLLRAKIQLRDAKSESDRELYQNKCAALDRKIDETVYELYKLKPEDIDLVETDGSLN